MKKILKVKPTLRGGKTVFDSINASLEFEAGGDKHTKAYDRTNILNSKILLRPQWNQSTRRYNSNLNEEELLELNKVLKLRDAKNQLIKEIDLHNKFDSFINHPDLKITIDQEAHVFDTDIPLEKAQLAYIEARNDVSTVNNKVPQSRFDVTNYEDKVSSRKAEVGEKAQAFIKISKLKIKEAAAYARAMSLKVTKDNGLDFIVEKLNEQAEINPKRTLKTLNLDKVELYINDSVIKGINSKVIQYSPQERAYIFDGENVGMGRQDVFKFFTEPINQELLLKLQEKVE